MAGLAEAGKKVISSRKRLRELIAYFGGKVVHPVLGLPGGVSKALKPEDLPRFKQLAHPRGVFSSGIHRRPSAEPAPVRMCSRARSGRPR